MQDMYLSTCSVTPVGGCGYILLTRHVNSLLLSGPLSSASSLEQLGLWTRPVVCQATVFVVTPLAQDN